MSRPTVLASRQAPALVMTMQQRQSLPTRKSGFSLIELVVVIMIMTILAGVIIPRVADRQAAARDARRLTDLRTVQNAIEQYFLDNSAYPTGDGLGPNGWDTSEDGSFIPELIEKGYIRESANDPSNDAVYHYRYCVYDKDSYGCVGNTSFYVLGIKKFEIPETAAENPGYFKCTGRDWSGEFDYVTGGGASFK